MGSQEPPQNLPGTGQPAGKLMPSVMAVAGRLRPDRATNAFRFHVPSTQIDTDSALWPSSIPPSSERLLVLQPGQPDV